MKKNKVSNTVKNKGYKFRMYPNEEQKVLINKTFGCVRFIYNEMLENERFHYKSEIERIKSELEKLNLSEKEFEKELELRRKKIRRLKETPATYKKIKGLEFLKEVDSLALCNAQINLDAAYNNFFKSHFGKPQFKSKHKSRATYTTNFTNNNISLEKDFIKLPKLGSVKLKQHRPIPKGYILKSATVSKAPSGKYFVSVLFEYESQIQKIKPIKFLGLDYSMGELFRDSEGNSPNYPKFYRKSECKLKKEQRKLSLMIKGSKNRGKQRIKVAKIHEKITNQRNDFLHKLSRNLTNNYDCICIEDLNMKAMSQALNFGKSVADNGWGKFCTFLDYKLKEAGKELLVVDKFFASSQLCSFCGHKYEKVRDLSVREWICPCCNAHHNRDINAAINIRNQGMRVLEADKEHESVV